MLGELQPDGCWLLPSKERLTPLLSPVFRLMLFVLANFSYHTEQYWFQEWKSVIHHLPTTPRAHHSKCPPLVSITHLADVESLL